MRILVIGNFSVARCGIRNWADMLVTGLSVAGAQVDRWDATYDLIYARREAQQPTYLPPDDQLQTYDVVLLNWHPVSLNTYNPEHFPWAKGDPRWPLVSVYLNDVPPWSGCPVAARADCVIAPEATPEADLILPYPIPDWVGYLPEQNPEFTVGISGVRGDGFELIRAVCERHGWALNTSEPGAWIPLEEEVCRLARSAVNVCWYLQDRGIAGTPGICLASRRPLLVSDSAMFRHLQGYGEWDRVYHAAGRTEAGLEEALVQVEGRWRGSGLLSVSYDDRIYHDLGWSTQGPRLIHHWQRELEARAR